MPRAGRVLVRLLKQVKERRSDLIPGAGEIEALRPRDFRKPQNPAVEVACPLHAGHNDRDVLDSLGAE